MKKKRKKSKSQKKPEEPINLQAIPEEEQKPKKPHWPSAVIIVNGVENKRPAND